jgi:hypothetical protein
MKKRFYKENGIWYIDLPEFLEQGLGTITNLMMVDGADSFLDILSRNGNQVLVHFSDQPLEGASYSLIGENFGKDQQLLSQIGHAFVSYGRYYTVPDLGGHRLWLCPVTEFVFGGHYPDRIWIDTYEIN